MSLSFSQALLVEKARLAQENSRLARENAGLRELLAFTTQQAGQGDEEEDEGMYEAAEGAAPRALVLEDGADVEPRGRELFGDNDEEAAAAQVDECPPPLAGDSPPALQECGAAGDVSKDAEEAAVPAADAPQEVAGEGDDEAAEVQEEAA